MGTEGELRTCVTLFHASCSQTGWGMPGARSSSGPLTSSKQFGEIKRGRGKEVISRIPETWRNSAFCSNQTFSACRKATVF